MLEKVTVEIQYRKGPTFSTWYESVSADIAKELALKMAKQWGFCEKVKKVIVRKEYAQA